MEPPVNDLWDSQYPDPQPFTDDISNLFHDDVRQLVRTMATKKSPPIIIKRISGDPPKAKTKEKTPEQRRKEFRVVVDNT